MKKALLTGISAAMLLSPFVAITAPATSAAAVTATVAASPAYKEAVTQGNVLASRVKAYSAAINSGDIVAIDALYDGVTKQLKVVESSIGKVSGAANRAELLSKYVTPAKKEIERTIYEVSQYRLVLNILMNLTENEEYEAYDADMTKLERLKKRAVAIKEAGKYSPLHADINLDLRYLEAGAASVNLSIYDMTVEYFVDEEEEIFEAELYYDDLTRYLKQAESKIGQVPSPKARVKLLADFVQPAKVTVERVKYEVSQVRLLDKVEVLAKAGKITEAKAELAKLDRLRDRAAAIKEAGKYQALPKAVDADIRFYEQQLRAQYKL
ncbi:hypothetical protein GJU40_16115 [Bacillus lacus]|uniref:SbsC C-terminal domain-containing protein n=1 Tax=Metabacillus lacus TaxID=1983721 RepID=A0A7X2J1D2_9BACI|nr:hypothetical protein [Metabacillus lacus]MRX73668.1 hypothetical protein [Metabacillus lacus]